MGPGDENVPCLCGGLEIWGARWWLELGQAGEDTGGYAESGHQESIQQVEYPLYNKKAQWGAEGPRKCSPRQACFLLSVVDSK